MTTTYPSNILKQETDRLFQLLKKVGWSEEDCRKIAPTTLEIQKLKKSQNAIILAHSYQTPEIMYGVADFIGDSYGLSKIAAEHHASKIIFSSVHFMGETAKILSPNKEVLVPDVAGCSLAQSINGEEVRKLKKKNPNAGVVCYINTTAEVKAECDVCCTSANALEIVNAVPQDEVIFIPDKLMGQNLQKKTDKKLILWEGTCIVHEIFSSEEIDFAKNLYPGVRVLSHLECDPEVVDKSDMSGSTADMLNYIKNSKDETFMLITECGISDRVRMEISDKQIIGGCNLCPFMKKITLKNVLKALKDPTDEMRISIPRETFQKAEACIQKMFDICNANTKIATS
jgi:quinolinate synthase